MLIRTLFVRAGPDNSLLRGYVGGHVIMYGYFVLPEVNYFLQHFKVRKFFQSWSHTFGKVYCFVLHWNCGCGCVYVSALVCVGVCVSVRELANMKKGRTVYRKTLSVHLLFTGLGCLTISKW